MKKVNITLSEKRLSEINKLYPTQKEGLEFCVENYLTLRSGILKTLQGKFTRAEWVALLDIHNGIMYEARFTSPGMLLAHLEDAENLDGTCTSHGAKFEDMQEKIKDLNHAQSMILVEECWRFWNAPSVYDQNIDKFIEAFI